MTLLIRNSANTDLNIHIKLIKSAVINKIFSSLKKEEFIESHRSENEVFSREKGVQRWFFSRLARRWAHEIRPWSRSLDTLERMQTFIARSSRTDDGHVSTFVDLETHHGTSFFFFGRNTRSGWRTASISRDFLPRRDSYFLIKQRTCTSHKKWMHDRYVELAVLATRCVLPTSTSAPLVTAVKFARFGIVKTRMKWLFLASREQVCMKRSPISIFPCCNKHDKNSDTRHNLH